MARFNCTVQVVHVFDVEVEAKDEAAALKELEEMSSLEIADKGKLSDVTTGWPTVNDQVE